MKRLILLVSILTLILYSCNSHKKINRTQAQTNQNVLVTEATKLENRSCKKFTIELSVANYKDEIFMKEKYRNLFDSLLQKPIYHFFCEQGVKGLVRKINLNFHKMQVSIEPFFVDLDNGDGLYGYRFWYAGKSNPRFLNGNMHSLFVVSNKKYYKLSNDSISNVKIIKKRLGKTFTQKQLDRIFSWDISWDHYFNNYSFDWPIIIKRDTVILWNIDKEIESLTKLVQ